MTPSILLTMFGNKVIIELKRKLQEIYTGKPWEPVKESVEFIEESYDRPFTPEEIKSRYGEDVYKRLMNDPVHQWRAETGIELIHVEPSKAEFERIWVNWNHMSQDQKNKSDQKSIELFKRTNIENYNFILKHHYLDS